MGLNLSTGRPRHKCAIQAENNGRPEGRRLLQCGQSDIPASGYITSTDSLIE